MNDRIFLDTNILVYVFDNDCPEKQKKAQAILEQTTRSGQAVLSTQVLQEFYVVVHRKLQRPLSEEDAEQAVRRLANLPVVQVDTPMILSAIGTCRSQRLSFWDALIVQAALESDCRRLLTEDLQPGLRIGSLRIENPFSKKDRDIGLKRRT